MADNITLDSMSGGSVVATDDIGGIHYQIMKLAYGALDSATLVDGTNALPVVLIAGSAAFGKLAANSGVDIGDVTINNASGASAVNIQDGGNSLTVDAAELTAIQTAVQIMDDWDNGASDGASVSGDVAHDTADAGEPVKFGGKALDIGANPTDVSANDRTNAYFTRAGQQFVIGGHPNTVNKHIQVTDADGAQTDVALITVSAGTAIVVTRYKVAIDAATTNAGGVAVRMGFGTASTPAVDANTGMLMASSGFPAGGGSAEGNGGGIIGMGASNEDLRLTCEDPAGGNIDITVSYFTITIG